MAKGGASKMIYFVLYIVLISELLIVITERDELEEAEKAIRDQMLVTISQSYKKPIRLDIPEQKSDFILGKENQKVVAMIPVGLVSDEEKLSIKYFVGPTGKTTPAGWPGGTLTNGKGNESFKLEVDNQGNAKFIGNFKSAGEYQFLAYFTIERKLPEYLKPVKHLYEALEELVGKENLKGARSKDNTFIINVKSPGTGTVVGPSL